jgi:hypothetical protein
VIILVVEEKLFIFPLALSQKGGEQENVVMEHIFFNENQHKKQGVFQ